MKEKKLLSQEHLGKYLLDKSQPYIWKSGCKVIDVHIINNEQIGKEDKPGFEDIPILQDFADVFLKEILGLPPKQDLDFTIELVPGAVLNSKSPYWMNILEMNELKSQLQELIEIFLCKAKCIPLGSIGIFC